MTEKMSDELAELLRTKVSGNYAEDRLLISKLSAFIYKSGNLEEQKIAMRYMSEDVMGFPQIEVTEKMIIDANDMYKEFHK